jgi:hypothetical protein
MTLPSKCIFKNDLAGDYILVSCRKTNRHFTLYAPNPRLQPTPAKFTRGQALAKAL